jgi:hypothetical protein
MGALIRLAAPTPAGADAERVSYSVGRSLSATDFVRQDRYIDARLLGLAPAIAGAITGLGVSPARFDSPDGTAGLTTLTIGAGSGISGDGHLVRLSTPISVAWTDLVRVVTNRSTLANGAYLVLVRTAVFDGLEGPPPDERASPDPLLDIRQDSFVEVWLSASIGPLPASRSSAQLALALNTLVGGLTPASLGAAIGNGVPLALVLVLNSQAILLSQAAGRLPADPNGLGAMLLAQVREAFAMALAEPGADPSSANWQSSVRARFRFLPAAGELPAGLLLAPEAVSASCPFFPPGFTVYLQAIRASQAPHLLQQALGGPQLDLTSNTAQAVALALAIPDAAWTRDLLDLPRADPVLAADVHLAYARARAAQVVLREAWIALYGGMNAVVAARAQAVGFLIASDAAAQDLSSLLNRPATAGGIAATDLLGAADLATSPVDLLGWIAARITPLTAAGVSPPPVPVPTTDAATASRQLAELGYQMPDPEPAQADPAVAGHVPINSDTVLAPLIPSLPQGSNFASWTAAITATQPDPPLLAPLIDAGIVDANSDAATRAAAIAVLLALPATGDPLNDDTQPGALLRLALLQLFYAVFVRIARSHEFTLDAHRRLIALQRQHLDIMSTSVSALAGGVPSDGSGLTFTRLIPFVTLTAAAPTPTTPTAPTTPTTPPSAGNSIPVTPARGAGLAPIRTFSPTTPTLTSGRTAFQTTGAITGVGGSTFSQTQKAPIVESVPTGNLNVTVPQASPISEVLGSQIDVAKTVAEQVGVISQAPTFQYAPVQYGTAAHITSSITLLQTAVDGVTNLRNVMKGAPFNIGATTAIPDATATDEPNRYANIVKTTYGLLQDITLVENNALAIERAYLQFRDRIQSLQTRIAQLTDTLAIARDRLRAAQVAAAKAAGDYAAAQRLVLEETARVTSAAAARHQAITSATGLFYVRELQTLTSRELPPALTLTADTPDDLAPGCASDHPGAPAAIQPFLELLLEVPLANWWFLQGAWTDLPDLAGVQRIGALRASRLANPAPSASFGSGAAAGDLSNLAGTTRTVFEPLFSSAVTIGASLAETQQAAFAIFSLPDIVTLPISPLRIKTEALRARLESAAGCLFETLTALPPSARFAWASLARDGTLQPLNFVQWPVPPGVRDAGATTLRRLSALVNWMAAQLSDRASAAAQTALGNLVSATVIAAAYGDPNDTVTGTVVVTGGIPRPGVPIRVILNRTPPIGTVLHLLDENQNVVGTIKVQDQDALGTTASVVTSFAKTAPTSGWTVSTPGGRAPWLSS